RDVQTKTWTKTAKPTHDVAASLNFTKALLEGEHPDLDEHFEAITESMEDVSNYKAVQMHNRYLMVEAPGEIQIWDQHAAAERIRYEKLLKEYELKGIESQSLLTPVSIPVSPKQLLIVEEFATDLKKLGFEIEPFGKNE